MPQSNVLREFLVKIGFKVDDEQFKRFQNTWKSVGQSMASVATTAIATATAVSIATIKTADGLEKLYYGAQRTGDSVKNLQAFRFAAEQIGITAQDAASAVEGMAKILRNSPGHNALLATMGIDPRQGTTQKFMQLAEVLTRLQKGGPAQHARAAALAQQFGISEEMLTMLSQPGALDKFKNADQARSAQMKRDHVDPDKVAAQSRDFMNKTRETAAAVDDIKELSAQSLMPTLTQLDNAFQKLIATLGRLDDATGGKSTAVGTVAAGLGVTKISEYLLKKIFGGGKGAAGAAGKGAAGAGEAAAAGEGAAFSLSELVPVIAAGVVVGYLVKKGDEKYGTGIRKNLGLTDDPEANRKIITDKIRGVMGSAVKAINNVTDPLLARFTAKNEGFSATQYDDAGGKSIGYGHHLQPGEKLTHVDRQQALALLAQDMAKAATAVKTAVKAKLNANQMAALEDFAYNVGGTAFAKSTLLKDVNAGKLGNVDRDLHMYDKIKQQDGTYLRSSALDNRRTAESQLFNKPSIAQETTIHVTGNDPQQTAKMVAREQKNVNGQLVRQSGALDTVGN
jgi:GH24 family phage-related lysozyme (muramidase)